MRSIEELFQVSEKVRAEFFHKVLVTQELSADRPLDDAARAGIAAVRNAVLDDLIAEAEKQVQTCAGHLDDEASWIDTAEWLRSKMTPVAEKGRAA